MQKSSKAGKTKAQRERKANTILTKTFLYSLQSFPFSLHFIPCATFCPTTGTSHQLFPHVLDPQTFSTIFFLYRAPTTSRHAVFRGNLYQHNLTLIYHRHQHQSSQFGGKLWKVLMHRHQLLQERSSAVSQQWQDSGFIFTQFKCKTG